MTRALEVAVRGDSSSMGARDRFPLARGPVAELGMRSANGKKRRVLYGTMLPFDEWVEIDSLIEGHFMESFAPGSTDKTFAEGRDRMRCIFHHGKDKLGRLVLGKITDLHSDAKAAYFEVELFDGVEKESPLLIEGIEAGEYGTSVFYESVRQDYKPRAHRSTYNPTGIAELRVLETKVLEFGPTPFAIYPGATAGLRSLTDDFVIARLADDPEKLRAVAERAGLPLAPELTRESVRFTNGPATFAAGAADGQPESEDPRSARRYERACEYVGAAVWAMHPAVLATALQIIGERAQGYRPTAEEVAERLGRRALDIDDEGSDEKEPPAAEQPVRVIRVHGPIVPHAGMMADVSTPGRSVEAIQADLREAMSDETVTGILLDIDSPGGSVDLIPELAAEIRDARQTKPIWAIANTWAASGGYYIASAASEVIVTPSGEVGSIGVYTAHQDISELQAKEGRKTTLVHAGKYKVEGNPFEPLDDEARAEIQDKVDAHYSMFVKAVAKGRGVKVKQVEDDFGQGRMVMAEKAVERGMADRVATFDQTLALFEKQVAATTTKRAAAPDERAPERSDATTLDRSRRSTQLPTTDYLQKKKEEEPWRL